MSQLKESQHLKIPFKVIKEATQNFKTCVGNGGYGSVYKGELLISEQHTTVAVKRLNEKFGQGIKEFLTEIDMLKGQKHRNLISLIGYCDERGEKIIVYEYAERGSLDQYIRHDKTTDTLSWLGRLKICLDAAHGLDYLHNHAGKHQAIIHRDIKSANILLDCDWVAKISDLGLSKLSLAGLDRSTVISLRCGTRGYIEPEYHFNCTLTKESDVYSFGMVLLEILCGRLCNIRDRDGFQLSDYCYKMDKLMDKLHTVIDPNLRGEISYDSFLRFKSIAKGCLHGDRKQRLPIYRVVKELEEALRFEESIKDENGKKSGSVASYNSQDWIPKVPFKTLYERRTNVGKIFDVFDINRDGILSGKEVAAFLFVTKPGEEQLSVRVDEFLSQYPKYIDGKKGLTYHGLLQYYDNEDGNSDLGADIQALVSDSDDSDRRKNLIWLFQKLNSNKFGDLKPPVSRDRSDRDSEVLELLSKPDDDKQEAALRLTSPESSVKPFPIKAILLSLLIVVAILAIAMAMILVKVKHMWFLFLVLFNSIYVLLNYRKKMH